jgi:hypothetical protein
MEATSAISERPCVWKVKSLNLDCRFGNKTLSSLALPIFDFGSSCSLSMENLADKPLINRLVRKSSDGGRALATSSCGIGSGSGFFLPLLNVFDVLIGGNAGVPESVEVRPNDSDASFAFFFVRKRFILTVLAQSAVVAYRSVESMERRIVSEKLSTKRLWASTLTGMI